MYACSECCGTHSLTFHDYEKLNCYNAITTDCIINIVKNDATFKALRLQG